MRSVTYILLFASLLLLTCRKNEHITSNSNAKLNFSQDNILFDTIFTSIGSITKRIKIINKNNDALNISQIKLSGGASSPFSININGLSAGEQSNVFLNGQDSLNLFVKVTINPNTKSLPFLVQDSIVLNTNGNRQVIQLTAYGQNAIFINGAIINTNTTWSNALPYVINNSVTIKNSATLNILPGTKVYFHKDAIMNIEGNLNVTGSLQNPVNFCSDRLENTYNDEPGQWKGIHLKNGGNGLIQNAIIKNASVGITADSLSTNPTPKLILTNTIIKNMQVAAYIGYHSELLAFNNLIYNCGNYLIYAVGGGNYNLKQNTFAGYNLSFPRKTAALTFSDYLPPNAYNKLQLNIVNNIIYGSLDNELDILQKKTAAQTQLYLGYNLIKTSKADYAANSNILNIDPMFKAISTGNFEPQASSIVLKKGTDLSVDGYFYLYLNKDLKNTIRFFPSSLGCYENN